MTLSLPDFRRFCARLSIPSRDEGVIPFTRMYGTQDFLLQELAAGLEAGVHEFVVLKGGRQIGGTTIGDALSLYWLQTYPGMVGCYTSDDDDNRDFRRDVLLQMLDSLPTAYRWPTRVNNQGHLAWSAPNRSRLIFAAAGKRFNLKSNLGRSRGLNFRIDDEIGAWNNEKAISSLNAAFSKRHPRRFRMSISTAQGAGPFRDMVRTAQSAVSQRFIFLAWYRREDFRIDPSESAMWERYGEEPPSSEEREWMDAVAERYEVVITQAQLAWYRWTLAEEFFGDTAMMDQEYGCLIGSTRISTDRGLIRISEARAARRTESGKIVGWVPLPEAAVVRIRTRLGRILTGTPDHRIERADGSFVALADSAQALIKLRAPMFGKIRVRITWSPLYRLRYTLTIDERWGRFLGYFVGDGSYVSNSVSIVCNAKDSDVIADVKGLLADIISEPGERQVGSKLGGLELRVGSVLFREIMKRLGMWNAEKPHRRVCVPEVIFRSPQAVVREFLRGVFESDGFIDHRTTRIVLFSKWPDFLRDVQLLLLGFDVTSRVHSKPRRTGNHHYIANELILVAEETRVFNERIGFIGQRKRGRVHPVSRFTPKRARRPIELIDEVLSVEPAGVEAVYDIGLEDPPHTFSANGIVVHNSLPEQCFVAFGDRIIGRETIKRLQRDLARAPDPATYRYDFGTSIDTMRLDPDPAGPLRIWEEPDPQGVYVVSAHPARSSDPDAAAFVCQVWRAWADELVQVAEYAADEGSMYQFAWLAMHLAGAYRCRVPAFFALEVGTVGKYVLAEIQRIQNYGYGLSPTAIKSKDLRNIIGAIQMFMYVRPDQSTMRSAPLGWKMSAEIRPWIIHQLRDEIERGHVVIRSPELIDGLDGLRRGEEGDADVIEAGGVSDDSRVVTASYAVEHWLRNALPTVHVLAGQKRPDRWAPKSVEGRLVGNYLQGVMQRGRPR